ncbi:MAG: hypothetical protein QNK23_01610 [Crocinitomicaceae bacterium]|nr:hypothetical protein [Crocinitomicaceae bacterium]
MNFLIPIAFTLFASGALSQEHLLEEQLYNCLEDSYKAEGVNLTKQLENFETILMEEGILRSKDGEGYYHLFDNIAAMQEISFGIDDGGIAGLVDVQYSPDFNKECVDRIKALDSIAFQQTKYNALINHVLANLEAEGAVTAEFTAEAVHTIFTPEDLEIPFYRAQELLLLIGFMQPGEPVDLPLPNGRRSDLDLAQFELDAREEGYYIANGHRIETAELQAALTTFMRDHPEGTKVLILMNDETQFSPNHPLVEIIDMANKTIQDERAQELFAKERHDLSAEEREELDRIFGPVHIVAKLKVLHR